MSKIFKVILTVVVTSLLLTAVVGCAQPTPKPPPAPAPKSAPAPTPARMLQSIKASPASVSLAKKGSQQLQITATVDTTTEYVTAKCTYKSSDAKVATVSTGGLVTGVATGSVTVTVSYTAGTVTKTVDILVTVK